MKTARLVPPKPVIVDQKALIYFFQSGFMFLLGLLYLGGSFFLSREGGNGTEPACWEMASLLLLMLSFAFGAIGKMIQNRKSYREETAARLAEQEDRIRRLEAQVAELTAQRNTH